MEQKARYAALCEPSRATASSCRSGAFSAGASSAYSQRCSPCCFLPPGRLLGSRCWCSRHTSPETWCCSWASGAALHDRESATPPPMSRGSPSSPGWWCSACLSCCGSDLDAAAFRMAPDRLAGNDDQDRTGTHQERPLPRGGGRMSQMGRLAEGARLESNVLRLPTAIPGAAQPRHKSTMMYRVRALH